MTDALGQYSQNTEENKPDHPYATIPLETRIDYLRRVPKELKGASQWLLFKLSPRLRAGEVHPSKWDKIPFYCNGQKRFGEQGTEDDKSKLVTLPKAVKILRAKPTVFHGVGYACLDGGLASVIDLDGEESVEHHAALLKSTWCERSVSGVGAHAFFLGNLGTNKKRRGLEAFSTKGFIAVTGMPISSSDTTRRLAHVAQVAPTVEELFETDLTPIPHVDRAAPRSIATPFSPQLGLKLRSALRVLDADMDYDTWHQIGMALHATNPDPAGKAFAMWDAWSAKGTKYQGQEDLMTHWRSFRPGGGITEGTIFGMADRENRKWRTAHEKATKKTQPPPPPPDEADDEADGSGPRVVVTMLDQIEPAAQPWLLRHVFARGELTLLTGDGGTNKSSLSHAITHILVNGGRWPLGGFEYMGENVTPQGEVLIMCGEEGLSTSIVPRLKLQGTNRSKVGVVDLATDFDENGNVLGGIATFSDHLRLIERAIRKRGPGKVCMLIVDPLTGYLGIENQNSESEVRPVLLSMVQMARRLEIAICAIMHLNKKVDSAAADRILGSVAFKNVSRVSMSVVKDPDDPENRRYCIVTKSNLGAQQVGLSIRRIDHPDPLDKDGKIVTVEIDDESHRGLDADALSKELAIAQRLQSERSGTLTDTIRQIVLGATQPLTGAEIRELAEPQWRQQNQERELPSSWVQMVDNALSRLCRSGRVNKIRKHRGQVGHKALLPQLYTVFPPGLQDIL